jgi:N-acetyl-anhydromuramyl-L-alanine amidase AmpD
MLHYDASVTDPGSLEWLLSPKCTLGYNFLVWDDGEIFEIIPRHMRAPHAGVTRTSDKGKFDYPDNEGNSAFVGVAIAAGGRSHDRATAAQIHAVAWLSAYLFQEHKWAFSETWRFTTHKAEAWPRGRKSDCPGPDLQHPVMSQEEVVQEFRRLTNV